MEGVGVGLGLGLRVVLVALPTLKSDNNKRQINFPTNGGKKKNPSYSAGLFAALLGSLRTSEVSNIIYGRNFSRLLEKSSLLKVPR